MPASRPAAPGAAAVRPRSPPARPVFFDLLRIRQPVNAIVSFGHRVSGMILVLLVPVLAYALQCSLRDAEGFANVTAFPMRGWGRLITVLAAWALAHHLFAGIRHLLFDVHVATSPPHRPEHLRPVAIRASAWVVLAAELVVVLLTVLAVA